MYYIQFGMNVPRKKELLEAFEQSEESHTEGVKIAQYVKALFERYNLSSSSGAESQKKLHVLHSKLPTADKIDVDDVNLMCS